MRVWGVLLALLLTPALAGCLAGSSDAPASQPATDEDVGVEQAPPLLENLELSAPDLDPGHAWTYTASGRWAAQDAFTVVVAENTTDGYLFAAAKPAQLAAEIAWGRPWFGELDPELAETHTAQDGGGDQLFDFPLTDGKTWTQADRTMEARAANVSTPLGMEPGFVITAEGPDTSGSWSYAPSVGYLTWYRFNSGGEEVLNVSLQRLGSQTDWAWFEQHARLHVEEGAGPQADTFEVSEEADAVVGYAGGDPGATVSLTPPPPGSPWTYRFEGDSYENIDVLLPAQPGTWMGMTHAEGNSTAYVRVAAVSWLGPG